MGTLLTQFFAKHPMEGGEMTAIKLIHKKLEMAQHCLKKDKDGKEHLKHLAKAHSMLEDYFTELNINPQEYL